MFFLLPSEGGFINGLPIGRVETIGLALVAWIAAHRVRIPGAWLAGAAGIAAFAMSLAVPGQRGLQARYYDTESASGPHERSTEGQDLDFTRVDPRIEFDSGTDDFPLTFVNDHTRFNYMQRGDPDRRRLPFAAAWTGWWFAGGGTQTIYLHAPQAIAQISIDGDPVLESTAGASEVTTDVAVTRGWHRLHIDFSSPYGGPRDFSAGVKRQGAREPFDGASLRTDRIDGRQTFLAGMLARLKPLVDAMAIAWLATLAAALLIRRLGELWQRRRAGIEPALALFCVFAAAEALRFAWPWATRLRIMTAGDDTMVYEAYARDIVLNGILMNGGLPLGQGEPFYFQAFYPYFLAASHVLFGESFFGALFLQRLLVAVTAVALTLIAVRIRGREIWPVALLVSTAFTYWKLAPISADLLSESLYVPLMTLTVLAMMDATLRPVARTAARAGLLAGLAAITRSTAMLSWALLWISMWVHLRGTTRTRVIPIAVGCTLAVFSLIAVRNSLVSNRFVPASTEFGITLRGGNEPPPGLVLDPGPRRALYDRLHLDGHTIEVVEYAITAPAAFAGNIGRKVLFVMGFYEPYAPGWGSSPVYIANFFAALAGAWLLWRAGALSVPASMALIAAAAQFALITLVYPKGERLIVPVHVLLVPYAAVALQRVATLVASQAAGPNDVGA